VRPTTGPDGAHPGRWFTGAVSLPDLAGLLGSPWLYPAIFAMAILDAFVFLAPSELLVLAAGTAAASGQVEPILVVLVAASGAVAGDHLCYQLGRTGGPRLGRLMPSGPRATAMSSWGRDAILRRGGVILLGARYIPGGRTAVTISAGAVAYPRLRFLAFDVLAASVWAVYYFTAGYVGGAFADSPWVGLVIGIGLAVLVGVGIQVVRWAWVRRVRRTR
jgi:membrane protein DedA with SNARE-associated domain